ncbi:uncharacterized protein Dmoj_GI26765 [Drosophila mojavensis]|uniref:Uncharacterized protein n=1 Tax=Drosophila mojavensis TaxID=7230 RepID=A0A0Q9X0D4_DROMO|nr:uncharacterized protein Dmoj_GI26765 [Drosophila mojavensis]
MNVLLVVLPVLLLIPIIAGKVVIAENTATLPNTIASREDLVTLSKYYVSIHKPYNVKKYVPYRPTNKTNILQIPPALLLPAVPKRTTQTPTNDFDWGNAEDDIEVISDIPNYSTEQSASTTEIPEMSTSLLTIIGTTPGFEATTPYYYINTKDSSTEEDYSNSSTTEPTPEATITTSSLAPESESITETSSTSFMDTTAGNDFTTEPTSTQPEATTEMENLKSLHQLATETTPTIDVTTNINWALPTTLSQSTTDVSISTTQEPQTSTSAETESTTNIASTTMQYTTESTTTIDLPDTTNLAISTTDGTTYSQTNIFSAGHYN